MRKELRSEVSNMKERRTRQRISWCHNVDSFKNPQTATFLNWMASPARDIHNLFQVFPWGVECRQCKKDVGSRAHPDGGNLFTRKCLEKHTKKCFPNVQTNIAKLHRQLHSEQEDIKIKCRANVAFVEEFLKPLSRKRQRPSLRDGAEEEL